MFTLNLPNTLTLLRIFLVPVVVVALLDETPNGDAIAAGVFALAAFTDGLDGYIARSRGDITTFGKLMDPLADKLLVTAALVALVSLGRLEAWIAMVIIAREFFVTGLRGVAVERGVVIQASWLGKVKTATQIAAVIALIVWDPAPLGVDILVYVAVAFTVASGVDYFYGFRRILSVGGSLKPLSDGGVPAGVLAAGELALDLAEEAVALGDDVVAVDRLEILLAGVNEGFVGHLAGGTRLRVGPSRGRRLRRSGGWRALSRRRRARRIASSARRSRDIDPSTIRSRSRASMSSAPPSGQPR